MNEISTGSKDLRSILITGATGGIGAELAKRYARPGRTLVLWGRNAEKLKQVAATCCARGAVAIPRQIDLTDGKNVIDAFEADDTRAPFDLVILGAGLSDIKPAGATTEDPQKVLKLALVNYALPVALATAAAQRMIPRGAGSLALIGSVAGFYELPFAASYSSSKAGLACFAEAARLGWMQHNINVTLIVPGFVDTPMSQRLKGDRPFLVSASGAAKRIMRAIANKEAECIFPWQFKALRVIERLLPTYLRKRILLAIKADQE